MDYDHLTYEQDGHVVTLTYDRPEQHNAINREMAEELHHAWQRFRDDDDAFVLVITGAGETTFSAGWDLQDASEIGEIDDWEAFRRAIYNLPGPCGYTRRVDVFKPIIAPSTATRSPPGWRPHCWPTSASGRRTPNSARSSVAGTSSAATA